MSATLLHAEVSGAGPDLVLLHPVGLDHTFWTALVDEASRSHRVVALDLRGHGRSPPAAKGTSLDDYADDVHRAVLHYCRGLPAFVGLSFGGMLAQHYALRHRGSVAALVACGCTAGFADEIRPVLRERGLAAERDGMGAIVQATLERWFTPAFLDDPAVARVRERLLANDVAGWSAAWHAIATFQALERLPELRVPALVVAGDRDAATPLAAAQRIADAIPGARFEVLAGAPHMMQIESGKAFAGTVTRFLRSDPALRGDRTHPTDGGVRDAAPNA